VPSLFTSVLSVWAVLVCLSLIICCGNWVSLVLFCTNCWWLV
jgi:hypothetical protein